jgi:hypothetical protein
MKIKIRILLVACGLMLVMGTTLSAAPQASEIVRSVIGGGGGRLEQSPYALDGTIGQSVVGQSGQTPYDLCAGFWCGAGSHHAVYLPLVLRNN